VEEGQRFGPYNLIKRIAFGGMAEIHLAKASGIGGFEKLLALKVIHPKFSADQGFIDMLVDEAKIAVQLSHVNIGQIFDLGRIEDTYYIAMEFIDGKDLYQLLVKCSELEIDIPLDIIVFIAMEVAAGLHYAHTKGDNYGRALDLIHRDISPQNVLISYDGEIKIVDFGIAKASQRSKETESGVIKGKFFYMSPEQAWGDPIDARTDIFSMGICLYEMIAGEMLYNEEKALALLDRVRKAQIPPMRQRRPDLPPALEGIVLKALARDRSRRYQTAGDLHSALSAFLYSNWPDFNRNRVEGFMRRVFGGHRFVLPLPAAGPKLSVEQAPVPVVASPSEHMMAANEVDPVAGKSVIFDLRQVQGMRATGPVEDDEDRTITAAPYTDSHDEEERTIAEVVWAPGEMPQAPARVPIQLVVPEPDDGEDATAVIDMDAVDAARALFAREDALREAAQPDDDSISDEPPTALFMRDQSMAMPQRAHRAKAPTAGSNLPAGAAAGLPSGPPPGLPPMPAGPLPPAPTPLAPPGSRPAPQMVSSPATPAPLASAPALPKLQAPKKSSPPDAFMPVSQPSKAKKPRKPRKPSRARINERDKPTVTVLPPMRRKGLAKLLSPLGMTIMGVVVLLVVGAVVLMPAFKKGDNAQSVSLKIDSVPTGAKVILDGTAQAQPTPIRIDGLVVGTKHTIRIEVAGYQPYEEALTVQPAEDGSFARQVLLKKQMGTLQLNSTPPGADVYMEGKYLGPTPLTKGNLDRDKNEVLLTVGMTGYHDEKVVLTWGEKGTIEHTVVLKKAK
jgi:serine/threonine-protein kinase